MATYTQRDHERACFRSCDNCLGGRVFWGDAEPQFRRELGLVGMCAMCGKQWFTQDLLTGHVVVQPTPSDPQRRSGPARRSGAGSGGWKGNDILFGRAS